MRHHESQNRQPQIHGHFQVTVQEVIGRGMQGWPIFPITDINHRPAGKFQVMSEIFRSTVGLFQVHYRQTGTLRGGDNQVYRCVIVACFRKYVAVSQGQQQGGLFR